MPVFSQNKAGTEKLRELRFSADFLRRLESLSVASGRKFSSGGVANRAGTVRGGRVEFLDHRGYVEGDDLRDLDWNVYARTGETFVKIFGAEREKHVHLVLDLSRSVSAFPEKEMFACRLAAAAGYIALLSGDTASLFSAAGEPLGRQVRGSAATGEIFGQIETAPPTDVANWNRFAQFFLSQPKRPGATIVISDFWDENIPQALSSLRKARQEISLLQVLTPDELSPSFSGSTRLEDAETGEEFSLFISEREAETCRESVREHIAGISRAAGKLGMNHILCDTAKPFEHFVLTLLRQGGVLK
jgi:uncharacterized protein (DUF58 family)